MKKLVAKLARRKPEGTTEGSNRITNETVAEHREKILAGGRKFKYPIQYARHKLVINTVIISVVALASLVFIGWWQLYPSQNTSEFMYRITQVLPLPVASVDGRAVPYSDYLMKYRSDVHYLEKKQQVNLNSEEGKVQLDLIKRQAMDGAIADAYANKLAKDMNISVSDAELEAFLKQQRQSNEGEVSEQTYNAVIEDYYDWSPEEYRYTTKVKLLRQKVSYAIDQEAESLAAKVPAMVRAKTSLKQIAAELPAINGAKSTYGQSGWVPKSNQDGGLAEAAAGLKVGQTSSAIKTTMADGYYFVKLLDINDTQVKYEYVKIPLTAFDKQIMELKAQDKIKTYITLTDANQS